MMGPSAGTVLTGRRPSVRGRGWVGSGEQRSSLYGLLGGRIRRLGGSRSGSTSPLGPSGGQTKSGACRSEGLVAGKHVPDGFGEPAGDVDLGDLGAALLAEPALGGLIAVGVGRVPERVHGRFEHRP